MPLFEIRSHKLSIMHVKKIYHLMAIFTSVKLAASNEHYLALNFSPNSHLMVKLVTWHKLVWGFPPF